MKLKLVFVTFMTLVLLLASNAQVYAECPDPGVPDSAYFLEPIIYCDDGQGMVWVDLPIYFAQYEEANWISFILHFPSEVDVVDVSYQEHYDTLMQGYTFWDVENGVNFYTIVDPHLNMGFPPHVGLFATLHLRATNNATHVIYPILHEFAIACDADFYTIDYVDLDMQLEVNVEEPEPGDIDCSGIVEISDAVHLIDYIFQGGIPPYNLNAADCDASCVVEVSDAVYLIEYIFNNGDAPQEGCVF